MAARGAEALIIRRDHGEAGRKPRVQILHVPVGAPGEADVRQVPGDRDAEHPELVGRADAREHQ